MFVERIGIKLSYRYTLIFSYLKSVFYSRVTELDTDYCKKPLFYLCKQIVICTTKILLYF